MGDGTTSVTVLAAELLRVSSQVATVSWCLTLHPNHRSLPSTGGGAPDCEEDPPADHHLWLEEGHSGGPRGSEGGGHGPQVSWTFCLPLNFLFLLSVNCPSVTFLNFLVVCELM